MKVQLGVVMDDIAAIHYKKDSTLAMLWAAQDLGWGIHYMEMGDLFSLRGVASATTTQLQLQRDPERWFTKKEQQTIPLHQLDIILMRKDPPFDMEFIYATYLLEQASEAGTVVVNHPRSLRDANEKVFATRFPDLTPPTLVTRSGAQINAFLEEEGALVLKPLDGMGGASIFKLTASDPNRGVILETLTDHGRRFAMAQRFIPEITHGDKRILVINGRAVPYALARIPAQGELRGNLAAGGRGVGHPLSRRDHEICEAIAPELIARDLIFVGLDVIGDYLTEVNVTSPTCIRELDQQFGLDIAGDLMAELAERVPA
ncbi:MAG: glutathione synthase [Gammaproteobacteria bacterium]|nr:glutathione synthase [Gammaproteobacteria bacterium]